MDSPPSSSNEEVQSTLDLRIASIFVILVAAAAGGLAPIVFKCFRSPGHPATLILRSIAAGVILSLALVHVRSSC